MVGYTRIYPDMVGYTWERFVSNGLARVLILVVLRGIELGGRPGEGVRYYIGLRIKVRARIRIRVRFGIGIRIRITVRNRLGIRMKD